MPELPAGDNILEEIIAQANGAPIVLDFQYDACAPCQEIAPEFEALKDDYPEVFFYKVDIFEHRDLLTELEVQAIPTFKVWYAGELESTFEGGDVLEELTTEVDTLNGFWLEN